MAKSTRVKAKAKKFVCQSRDQTTNSIGLIGEAKRELDTIEIIIAEVTAKAVDEHKDRINELKDVIKEQSNGVQTWCEANRDDLCKDGKTANLTTGDVSWRINPPSVNLSKIDDVIVALRKAKLSRFLTTKTSVNKNAILADPEKVATIKGVTINSDIEEFTITPFDVEIDKG